MSCEGPVISVYSAVGAQIPLVMSGTPSSRFLKSFSRERTQSSSAVLSKSCNAAIISNAGKSKPSDSALLTPTSATLSPHYHTPPARSRSMPRGTRCGSAEPDAFLPVGFSSGIHTPSPRLMRRAETVDTYEIRKEEFEEYTQVNQYKVLDIIGHGSYGLVRRATTDENDVYAMKIVGKRRLRRKSFPARPRPGMKAMNSPLNDIQREIAILKRLDHPNVVKLYEVLDDPQEDELILVFEYIPNGAVLSHLPTDDLLSESQAREYFVDVILGIEYLHSHHIIHRDIKPENLLLDDNDRIKIADFGVSEEIDTSESHLSRSAGTPAFLAPECLDASKKSYRAHAVDIWAAGVTLYCFIYGKVPWQSRYITELHDKIQHEDLPYPDNVQISPELKDILSKLLEKDPEKRITIPQLRMHPWILKRPQPLPSKEDNCQSEIYVSEEEIKTAFKPFHTPIHILVMIKQMAKKRSLSRPFSNGSPLSSPKTSPKRTSSVSPKSPTSPLVSSSQMDSMSQEGRRGKFAKSRNTPTICIDSPDDVAVQ